MRDDILNQQPFFGKWYLDRQIGSGTFGSVYSIYHDENGVRLYAAMKVLTVPKDQAEVEELRSQGFRDQEIKAFYEKQINAIVNEINIMTRFRGHDHIVCYEDHMLIRHHERIQWDIYIRMERLERLEDYLKRIRATRWDVLRMWHDISQALTVCHGSSIIHRDIKPDNILVSRDGYYKLVDFGIARYLAHDAVSTVAGTYPYMAPEVQERKPYDGRADIYSLGIVVYQLLNGNRFPFLPPYPNRYTAYDKERAIAARFSGEPIPVIPGLPEELMKVIQKSTAFDPRHRYASAAELDKEVTNITIRNEEAYFPLFNENGEMVPPVIPRQKGKKGKGFLIGLAITLLLVLLALIVVSLVTSLQ